MGGAWLQWDGTADTASGLTIATAIAYMCSALTWSAASLTPTRIVPTTMEDILTTATRQLITTVPATTGGPITRGRPRFTTTGDGRDSPGMDITVLTTNRILRTHTRRIG